MADDLKIIKKYYGEKMMHLCRKLFPTIIENYPGKISQILLKYFEPTRFLYEDIVNGDLEGEFKDFIYNLLNEKEIDPQEEIIKSPKKLLKKVGYNLYECKSEKDIQRFKKYYQKGEELCTFRDDRLDSCYVFFAVKENVKDIKRENFNNPKRQDEYGTSVISIQFTKDDSHTLSIKNRYNHKVNNPDATFSNNLDNIVYGLTKSFEEYYGLKQINIQKNFEIPHYTVAKDGKYYRYNYEIGNIYYCPNNIIIDNFEVRRFAKEKYIIMDYFILDLVKKEIRLYDKRIDDSFGASFDLIKKIEVINDSDSKEKRILLTPYIGENIIITLDSKNRIIKLENNNLKKIKDDFLYFNDSLKELNLLNLYEVGNRFLMLNRTLTSLNLPSLEVVGDYFLNRGNLEKIYLPNLKIVNDYFMIFSDAVVSLELNSLKEVGDYFMEFNESLEQLNAPSLEKVGKKFLSSNKNLNTLNAPNLKSVGGGFLKYNLYLKEIDFPSLEEKGDDFLINNLKVIEKEKKLKKRKRVKKIFNIGR